MITLRYSLPLNDVFFAVTNRNSVGEGRIYVRVIEFLVLLSLFTGIALAVMINTVDMVNLDLDWLIIIEERASYPNNEFEWCIISYYVMIAVVSGHGLVKKINCLVFFFLLYFFSY